MNGIMDYLNNAPQCCITDPGQVVITQFWDLENTLKDLDKRNMVRLSTFIGNEIFSFQKNNFAEAGIKWRELTFEWGTRSEWYDDVDLMEYTVNAKTCGPGGTQERLHGWRMKITSFGVAYNELCYMTLDSMGIRRNSDHERCVTCACLSEDVRQCLRDIRFSCVNCGMEGGRECQV
jgi:hypothetical protein